MFAFLAQRHWWDHMWGPWGGWGWGWMLFMMLVWLVFLGAVIWLAYRITRGQGWLGDGAGGGTRTGRAEEILRERYARGELDRETYLNMLEDLRRGGEARG